ncbi:MAG: phage tail protein [Pseudohongiella sp.]|nr:phage tail protein [Pseudohongiella sp.]
MAFSTKITVIGLAKLAAATAGGDPVVLTEMAVGDGNGAAVAAPTGAETELVNEVYRDAINQLVMDDADATLALSELLVPAAEGGFFVREIGVFDNDGDLFAYGNFPVTEKPATGLGATRDMVVQTLMKVGSASNVVLIADPSIVIATREWVLNNVTAATVVPGGTKGQVLTKTSGADGATEWQTPISRGFIYFMGQ